jgi:hypothetical protein
VNFEGSTYDYVPWYFELWDTRAGPLAQHRQQGKSDR